MKFSGRNYALLLALLCCQWVHGDEATDPVFGVPINWERLQRLENGVWGESENEFRVLSAFKFEGSAIFLLLSKYELSVDGDVKSERKYFEFDSGNLAKKVGGKLSLLGVSSGNLYSDYPEIKEEVLQGLLLGLYDTLLAQQGSVNELNAAISKYVDCDQLDKSTMWLIAIKKIGACSIGHTDSPNLNEPQWRVFKTLCHAHSPS